MDDDDTPGILNPMLVDARIDAFEASGQKAKLVTISEALRDPFIEGAGEYFVDGTFRSIPVVFAPGPSDEIVVS